MKFYTEMKNRPQNRRVLRNSNRIEIQLDHLNDIRQKVIRHLLLKKVLNRNIQQGQASNKVRHIARLRFIKCYRKFVINLTRESQSVRLDSKETTTMCKRQQCS